MSVQNILNNPKKIDKIARRVFNSVDKDGSGLIDMNELEKVMTTISEDLDLPIPSHKEFRVLIVGILESLA